MTNKNIPGLPLPRLELLWKRTSRDWSKKYCIYSLVIPLTKNDIRRENINGNKIREIYRIIIGRTRCTGGSKPVLNGVVDTPFRDRAHAKWDSEVLRIPVYAVCDGQFSLVWPWNCSKIV